MSRVRLLRHPGPVDPVRGESCIEPAGPAVRGGRTLLDAVVGPLASYGLSSATSTLLGGGLSRVRYVLARRDPASRTVVSLTDPIEAQDVSLVTGGGALGHGADGEPFIRCHALLPDRAARRSAAMSSRLEA
jgi:hypothetical protein